MYTAIFRPAFCFSASALLSLVLLVTSGGVEASVNNRAHMRGAQVREARELYARGHYTEAARIYESIPKTTPEFLRTREELAWSYLRAEDFDRLRGLLPHLNSELVPLRWRLEGRVLRSMLLLQECQYDEVRNEINRYITEMTPLARSVDQNIKASKTRTKKRLQARHVKNTPNIAYWRALRSEIQESIFKMKFVKMELRSRLVMLTREQVSGERLHDQKAEVIVAPKSHEQIYPVTTEFWADEVFEARGTGQSACAGLHKVALVHPTKDSASEDSESKTVTQ